MHGRTIGLAVFLGSLVSAPLARAETKTLSVGQVGTMVSTAGETRVLFKVNGLNRLDSMAIRRATLTIPYTRASTEDRRVSLRAMPVTRDWSGSVVSWTGNWTRPGGDYDEELYSRAKADLRRGSGSLTFDLTTALMEEVREGGDFYGFLVTVDEAEGEGLRSTDVSLLDGVANASVTLTYRGLPTGPLGAAR